MQAVLLRNFERVAPLGIVCCGVVDKYIRGQITQTAKLELQDAIDMGRLVEQTKQQMELINTKQTDGVAD